MAVSLLLFLIALLFDDGGDAQPARSTDRNQAASAAVFVNGLGQCRQLSPTGCGERVTTAEGAAVDVHLAAFDSTQRGIQAESLAAIIGVLPSLEGAQYLSGKGFVDLEEIKV